MTWYRRGWDWLRDKRQKEDMFTRWPMVQYLRQGEKKRYLFLDQSPFVTVLHLKKDIDGNWRYFVCHNHSKILELSNETKECLLCKEGRSQRICGLFTVLDCDGYKKKLDDGSTREFKYIRKMVIYDQENLFKIEKIIEEKGFTDSLGLLLEVSQKDKSFMKCGDVFEFSGYFPKKNWEEYKIKTKADTERNPWEPFKFESFVKIIDDEKMKLILSQNKDPVDPVENEEEPIREVLYD